MFEIDSSPGQSDELLDNWASAFSTSVDHVSHYIGLPLHSSEEVGFNDSGATQTRLFDIHKLLCRVRLWFSSDQATWEWFIGESLVPFGGLTPSEVVKLYHDEGIDALNEWVSARELAGFQ